MLGTAKTWIIVGAVLILVIEVGEKRFKRAVAVLDTIYSMFSFSYWLSYLPGSSVVERKRTPLTIHRNSADEHLSNLFF